MKTTEPASTIKCSSSRTETSEILDHQNVSQWPSNRHKNHECFHGGHDDYVFLYFTDDQIKSRSVLLLCLHHVMSHSIVVTCIFNHKIYNGGKSTSWCLIIRINHRSFPSLCTGENYRTVLEWEIKYIDSVSVAFVEIAGQTKS